MFVLHRHTSLATALQLRSARLKPQNTLASASILAKRFCLTTLRTKRQSGQKPVAAKIREGNVANIADDPNGRDLLFVQVVVSQIKGPQYRPPNTIILILNGTPNFGKPPRFRGADGAEAGLLETPNS